MLRENDRRTKIVWSFEPSCMTQEVAKQAAEEQFDALRLVYEPGAAGEIRNFIKHLRAEDKKNRVPIILDLTLPARAVVSAGGDPQDMTYGDVVRLCPEGKTGDIELVTKNWDHLFESNQPIYFGYGNVVFSAMKVGPEFVEAEVIQGGTVLPGMDVHVPATRRTPKIAQLDLEELGPLIKMGVDCLVAPGFCDPADIQELNNLCKKHGHEETWIMLKLNSDKVYENLERVLEHVHGVLISRLELALFVEPAMIPMITKEVIELCNDRAKIVCTASEMLGSMRHNATPTRAEVSDIANVVSDGSDAVVLTEEIPYGKHAVRAIRLMRKIVEDVEQSHMAGLNWKKHAPSIVEEMDAVAFGAYKTAHRVGAKAIVCLTHEGNTAVKLASFRTPTPIIAVTFSESVLRRLSIVRGVDGVVLDADPLIDDVLPVVSELLVRDSWLKPKDKIIFVSVTLSSLGRQESNLFTIQTLS